MSGKLPTCVLLIESGRNPDREQTHGEVIWFSFMRSVTHGNRVTLLDPEQLDVSGDLDTCLSHLPVIVDQEAIRAVLEVGESRPIASTQLLGQTVLYPPTHFKVQAISKSCVCCARHSINTPSVLSDRDVSTNQAPTNPVRQTPNATNRHSTHS